MRKSLLDDLRSTSTSATETGSSYAASQRDGRWLYRARAYRYPAAAMATLQTTAQITFSPTGTPKSRLRPVSITGVNGWCSANQLTPAGIDRVGTNALLKNGSNAIRKVGCQHVPA